MQSNISSQLFAIAAFICGVIGCTVIFWLEWRFYQFASTLPPGSEIRPMGQAADEVVTAFFTFLFAMPLSLAGLYFGLKQHRLHVWLLSVVSIGFAVAPLPLGIFLGRTIFAVKGIVFEP